MHSPARLIDECTDLYAFGKGTTINVWVCLIFWSYVTYKVMGIYTYIGNFKYNYLTNMLYIVCCKLYQFHTHLLLSL